MTSTESPVSSSVRRNLGRAARRRRKKARELQAASAAGSGPPTKIGTTPSFLADDRHLVPTAVWNLRNLSHEDEVALRTQLGYIPGNALEVVARVKDIGVGRWVSGGKLAPVVLRLYPLACRKASGGSYLGAHDGTVAMNEYEPFPTIFWCVHPQLKALISRLEAQGRGQELMKRLKSDPESVNSMMVAHDLYCRHRRSTFTKSDWQLVLERSWESAFDATTGVAGCRGYLSIKCLHAHAAHFWSGCKSNVVGQWVSEDLLSMMSSSAI